MLYGAPGGVRKRGKSRIRWFYNLEADFWNLWLEKNDQESRGVVKDGDRGQGPSRSVAPVSK